ncbi:MAG: hypothetical protein DHS20C12_11260 [Pseudohongiella sp.]|nr:MAG: hypothetical protein DHS20C12_11260 [Pseudohongiella sp.]
MIERLQRIATLLAWFRIPIFVLAGFSLLVLFLSVLENPLLDGDSLLMPAILGFCWALMLYSTGELFQAVPAKPQSEVPFRERMALRIRRAVLWVLAVLTIVSTAALVVLSYQLLRVWL